jgi:hypothetical protein
MGMRADDAQVLGERIERAMVMGGQVDGLGQPTGFITAVFPVDGPPDVIVRANAEQEAMLLRLLLYRDIERRSEQRAACCG